MLEYEMLAHHALPKFSPALPRIAGTAESNAAFAAFVSNAKGFFRARVPVEDIGVYYSSSSLLSFMTPAGYRDMDAQPHQFAFYGWTTALEELHYQYKPVVEWKLNAETLAALRLLIVPNATVLDPGDAAILDTWVRGGGRLIVTGDTGLRLGENGNFARNPEGLALAALTGVANLTPPPNRALLNVGQGTVLYLPGNDGMEYYLEEAKRAERLPFFSEAIAQVTAGREGTGLRLDARDVPSMVGLTLYEDPRNRAWFVDVNNYNIDLASDSPIPSPPIAFGLTLPPDVPEKNLRIRVIAPEPAPRATLVSTSPGNVFISLDSVSVYASVMLELADAGERL